MATVLWEGRVGRTCGAEDMRTSSEIYVHFTSLGGQVEKHKYKQGGLGGKLWHNFKILTKIFISQIILKKWKGNRVLRF